MTTNDRRSRFGTLSARLVLGFLGASAIASVGCGGDDDFALSEQPGSSGDAGSTASSSDPGTSTTSSSDASTGDATSSSATGSEAGSMEGGAGITTDASPIGIHVVGDGGVCGVVGGIFQLDAPSSGSALLCPTQKVLCSVAVDTSTCAVTTRCSAADGGVGGLLSLLSIPVQVVGPNDAIDYDASLPLPEVLGVDAGSLAFDCGVQFGDDSVALGVSCKATVPVVGTVDVCAYAGLPIDGGL
jgi:hypothetical protein